MKNILNILIFIIPFSVSLSPTEKINLTLTKIAVPLFFLVLLIRFLFKKIKIHLDLTFVLLTAFTFFSAISLFKTTDLFESFKKLSVFLAFFPLYILIASEFEKKDILKIYRILNSGALITSLGALVVFGLQFFIPTESIFKILTQDVFPWLFGYNFSQKITSYQSLIVNINGIDFIRANLFFPDPHTQGFFLGMILPISFFLYRFTRKIAYLISSFIIGLAFLLGFARGSYISFLITLLIVGLYFLIKIGPKSIVNFRLATIIVGFLLFAFANTPFYTRFLQSFNFTEGSIRQRFNILSEAMNFAKENLFWGIGLGNYALSQKNVLTRETSPANFHNTYLEILTETGLINLVVFMGLLTISIARSINTSNLTILMVLLFFSIYALFETIIYSHQVIPLLIIILATLAIKTKEPLRLNPSQ